MDIDYITRRGIEWGTQESRQLLRLEATFPRPRDLSADELVVRQRFTAGIYPSSSMGTLMARIYLVRN